MIPKPKFVVKDTDRNGNVRWYFRRPGQPKIRLRSSPELPNFPNEYVAATLGVLAMVAEAIAKGHNEKGYIYFLRSGGTIKIGFSLNPFARAEALKTGVAGFIDSIVAVRATRREERGLHRLLIESRISGEWFRADAKVLEIMIGAATSRTVRTFLEHSRSHLSPTGSNKITKTTA